jgi:hypothetical protein
VEWQVVGLPRGQLNAREFCRALWVWGGGGREEGIIRGVED